jgi:hypothetical protein
VTPFPSISRVRWAASVILFFTIASTVSAAEASDWQSRVTPRVQNLANAANAAQSVDSIAAARQSGSGARYDSNGRLQIDVEFDCAQPAPTASLTAAGMVIGTTVKAPPMCVVEGWAPIAFISTLASLPGVEKIDLPKYSTPHPPISLPSGLTSKGTSITFGGTGSSAIDGNGVTIMNAGQYIQQTGVNGAGVTIGVISDDVTNLATIAGKGELPGSINVAPQTITPTHHPRPTDEGTMMLEEVYAVAPGAQLAFCGPETYPEYVACLNYLIAAGATVVSDDLGFAGGDVMTAPAFNAESPSVENLLSANPSVMLFHAAMNDAKDYWQGAYNPFSASATCSPSGQPAQTDAYFQQFGASTSYIQWQTSGGQSLLLASVLPVRQAIPNNFDLYVYNPNTAQIVACGTSASGWTDGATSYVKVDGSAIPSGNFYIYVGTPDSTLTGNFIKLIGNDNGGGSFVPKTSGAPASPQDFAAGVITVGAVDAIDGIGNTLELYSNTGPIQIEVPSPAALQAPLLVAPDDIYVDTGGTLFGAEESDGEFQGTSAASPNAAAVAVLLRSAFPTLTPAQVTNYIAAGAAPLGGATPNGMFGYGRVDALGALGQIPVPTITGLQATSIVGGTSSAPLPFSVGGTGTLRVTALPSVFWMTTVISPSNCGNGAYNCTLTLTPAIGSFAPSTVQVFVTDGANRVQSMQIPITVTKPAPPAVSITSGAAQSVQVNASITPISIFVSGTGPLTVSATYNGAPAALTSGCGATVMTCSVSLGSAGTVTGPQSLIFMVQDSYGQSTSTSTNVTITNPPPPTIMITSGGSQSVMVNAAIAPVAFTLSGTGSLTVTPNTTGISSITISSGCGTTTMSCTASLGMAQSAAGTATLTLTVEDNYVQSASASAAVTENAPPGKSGGGALDPWALLGLTGLVLVQMNRSQRKRR